MTQIALFGTSADPPTAGHQAIISWLGQHFDRVAVWAADNPMKLQQTSLRHRSAMLQVLIEDIGDAQGNIHLYPELSSPWTLITLERARQKWPGAEFTLVIGADLVKQLPFWRQAQTLLKQVQLLVVPRPGYQLEADDLMELRKLGARVAIAALTGPAISSTAYRQDRDVDVLTPAIQAYIHREQLYACQENSKKRLLI
ncbi:MAG: nicotinate-nucleotide adenylyltransferase [Cyanothece sp. SIO1E1]|nr:nicotinate-nucleotide adenylyltransferase [Cyanothece sp. SIO1E1]